MGLIFTYYMNGCFFVGEKFVGIIPFVPWDPMGYHIVIIAILILWTQNFNLDFFSRCLFTDSTMVFITIHHHLGFLYIFGTFSKHWTWRFKLGKAPDGSCHFLNSFRVALVRFSDRIFLTIWGRFQQHCLGLSPLPNNSGNPWTPKPGKMKVLGPKNLGCYP